jgi:thiosulfate dehydrogenase (quinone) large subunit
VDPTTQLSSLVIQLHKNASVAYDAVCPHEGCTVAYLESQRIIQCHDDGSQFNPASGHRIGAPAPTDRRSSRSPTPAVSSLSKTDQPAVDPRAVGPSVTSGAVAGPSPQKPPPRSVLLSGWALLPLRAFLGVTFTFAGLQKLANPNFFKSSDPAGIYQQLIASDRISPLHPILEHLLRFSTPIGYLIALGELAVGLGVLLGLWTRIAAIGGAAISLMLFLAVSYHSSPYYTGSDIVFLFAWTPLILAGAGGIWSLDALIRSRVRAERDLGPATPVAVPFATIQRVCGQFQEGRCAARQGAPCAVAPCPFLRRGADPVPAATRGELTRRQVVVGTAAAAAAGVGGLAVAGAAIGIGRAAGGAKPLPAAATLTPGTTPPHSTAPISHPPGHPIGPAKDVPVGGAAAFTDPETHTPSLVIRLDAAHFVAFDAVCPHAGCTVGYLESQKIIACPCHGSEFNPTNGAVIQGPATRGLRELTIAKGSDGELYVQG